MKKADINHSINKQIIYSLQADDHNQKQKNKASTMLKDIFKEQVNCEDQSNSLIPSNKSSLSEEEDFEISDRVPDTTIINAQLQKSDGFLQDKLV